MSAVSTSRSIGSTSGPPPGSKAISSHRASEASSGGHLIVDNNDLPNEVKVKEGDLTENIDPTTDLNGQDSVSFTLS